MDLTTRRHKVSLYKRLVAFQPSRGFIFRLVQTGLGGVRGKVLWLSLNKKASAIVHVSLYSQ